MISSTIGIGVAGYLVAIADVPAVDSVTLVTFSLTHGALLDEHIDGSGSAMNRVDEQPLASTRTWRVNTS